MKKFFMLLTQPFVFPTDKCFNYTVSNMKTSLVDAYTRTLEKVD
jgi:hypothetical protein